MHKKHDIIIASKETASLYKTVCLFDNKLTLHVNIDDWDFLCENVFLTENPEQDEIEVEFITGTGITSKKIALWPCASRRFAQYISDLRIIRSLDINAMCRELLSYEEKEV